MRQELTELARNNPNQLYSKEITILSSQIEAITAEIFSKSLQ
jgi:hypothetical protein